MNFVPSIPQISQQNQGTGFGDWQQYAGYNKDNTFGGAGGLYGSTGGIKPPSQTKSTGTPAPTTDFSNNTPSKQVGYDYSIAPTVNSTMGASSLNTMGASLNPTNDVSSDIFSAFGVKE